MSPVFILILFTLHKSATASRSHWDANHLTSFNVYPRPAYLPILPYYQIEVPEQEAKFFGGTAATKYETIIVRETARPVCLFVDGNVPSCDHIHNYYYRWKNPSAAANNGRRPTTEVDYKSYLVEPSKPNERIEITKIPFRGTFLLTGTSVEIDDGHTAVDRETPALQSVRPVMDDVRHSSGDQRQLLQTVLSTTGLSGAVANIVGAGNAVANAVGLGGAVANIPVVGNVAANAVGLGGAVAVLSGAVANVVGVGGGGRQQVTVYVTRVEKVVDNRVTATLVPKNCIPASGWVDLLRPCSANPFAATVAPYPQTQPSLPEARPQPPVSVAVVSKVNDVLVKGLIDVQATVTHINDTNSNR